MIWCFASAVAHAGYESPCYIDGCPSVSGRYLVTASQTERGKTVHGPHKWEFVCQCRPRGTWRLFPSKLLTGRIWRVKYKGDSPLSDVRHKLDSPQWNDDAYAVSALGSPHHRVRERAIERLQAKGDSAVGSLGKHAATAPEALGAANALWTLTRMGTPTSLAAIANGAKHPDWRVRRLTVNLLRRYQLPQAVGIAGTLAGDSDVAVRVEAALALRDSQQICAARIDAFELAYRMQIAAPEALDLAQESAETKTLYGLENKDCGTFGRQCLIARRLVERGVRFVQVFSPSNRISGGAVADVPWDGHNDIQVNHRDCAMMTDQPVAALLSDLKARGLLKDTLVIWGGEFGRTSDSQGSVGRDHNPHANTTWMAGGGVKGGVHYGRTDEFGYKAVENRVSVYDLQATVLHLLGLDHTRLTYRFNGRDFRLTDVHGHVVKEILG